MDQEKDSRSARDGGEEGRWTIPAVSVSQNSQGRTKREVVDLP